MLDKDTTPFSAFYKCYWRCLKAMVNRWDEVLYHKYVPDDNDTEKAIEEALGINDKKNK